MLQHPHYQLQQQQHEETLLLQGTTVCCSKETAAPKYNGRCWEAIAGVSEGQRRERKKGTIEVQMRKKETLMQMKRSIKT